MYHAPVLLKESVDGLNINPNGIYVDVTFGGGGHSREILSRLSSSGRLFAFDQDADAANNIIQDDRLILVRGNFRYIRNYLEYYGVHKVDGILADLGVSSHQFDVLGRGFSYRLGGDLDMRMNKDSKITAAEILNEYDEDRLFHIFKNYCDVPNPRFLIKLIKEHRIENKFLDINDFLEIIDKAVPKAKSVKYLAQVFQALRIEVNDEMGALYEFLINIKNVLKKGGRLSVISYHSLEDRPVKNLIKSGNLEGKIEHDLFGRYFPDFEAVNRKIIVPSEQELQDNTRARSAKLRIAERL